MRKYAMPKVAYILLMMILLCLSIGYTYAYFSAIDKVKGSLILHSINVSWRDGGSNDARIPTLFDNPTTNENEAMSIAITGELVRGGYTQIKARDINNNIKNIKLKISNFGTTGAYCRIKITGTYLDKNNEQKVCEDGWLQLALSDDDSYDLITENGWTYYNGYYYYGADINSLTELSRNSGLTVADYLYLSSTSSADVYGATLNIVLTLEAVQSSNNAYKSVWNLV